MKTVRELAVMLIVAMLGFLLGSALLSVFTAPPEQPEPIVVVCTWTQGCEQTEEPIT